MPAKAVRDRARKRSSSQVSAGAFLGLDPESVGLRTPLADDIRLVDRLLGEVLRDEKEGATVRVARRLYATSARLAEGNTPPGPPSALFEEIPELREPRLMRKVLRAFTILFQVMNVAEQKEIVRANRERQADMSGGAPRPESIAEAVARLAAEGVSAEWMQKLLDRIEICPTITAHPTEARRRAVMDKLLEIADGLAERAVPADVPRLDAPLDLVAASDRQLLRSLVALRNTDELRARRVRVQDEVRNSVYFFQRTILDVVTWLHDDMQAALARYYPGHQFRIPPFLRYHTWVGGDRDGNPNVTPEVTWGTLLYHKSVMLRQYERRVLALRRRLSLSSRLMDVGQELQESLERDRALLTLPGDYHERYAMQPYALKLSYVLRRLRATRRHLAALSDFRAEAPDFVAHPPAYASSHEFLEDLLIIQRSLRASRASVLAEEGSLPHLIAQVRTFGFHLASLDIRQHSKEHAEALDEILAAAGVTGEGTRYSSLSEDEKVRILTRELHSMRPLLPRDWRGSEKTTRALEVFEVIRHARRYISEHSVTAYIISMTHAVSDVLEVLVLAREAGLVRWVQGEDGTRALESEIDVVPLFETIEDLQGCDTLLRRLFSEKTYKLHLSARGRYQEIMLGYSDSSKDGGYLAANWNLQDTQSRLAQACRRANLDFRFFHGRGGTVGRGGGRASRAILSQPPGSFTGRIRFTEQGEVVSFRYSLRPMAHRHLEQIVNSVMLSAAADMPGLNLPLKGTGGETAASPRRRAELATFRQVMAEMAAHSRDVYRALIYDDPDFWRFYTRATPIAHISRLPITSRPTMRSGGALNALDDLRAIPWVFAWVQCRYVVPGWYGMGSGFEEYARRSPENLAILQRMYREWPFFRTVVDNAQLELVRTHLPTARLYASLVHPARLRNKFHKALVEEYERTCHWVLQVTGQKELLENAPVVQRTVALRNPAILPLNRLQVALMDLWERENQAELGPESPWYDAVLLSITGVAAGMQSTG